MQWLKAIVRFLLDYKQWFCIFILYCILITGTWLLYNQLSAVMLYYLGSIILLMPVGFSLFLVFWMYKPPRSRVCDAPFDILLAVFTLHFLWVFVIGCVICYYIETKILKL